MAAQEQPERPSRQTEREHEEEQVRAEAARALIEINERLGEPVPQEWRDLAAKAEEPWY
jgi:hypothetical protein